jgi:hypothetical protein
MQEGITRRLIAGSLWVALTISGCAANSANNFSAALTSLTAGACTGPLQSLNEPAAVVTCDQTHSWEVTAIVPLTDAEYPGDDALRATAQKECAAAFTSYVGVEPSYSVFTSTYLAPSSKLWSEAANRQLVCLAGSSAGDLNTSLKGTAASLPNVGQCTGASPNGFDVDLIACTQPHNYEIYAEKAWKGKKAPTSAEFDALYASVCVAGFTEFVGIDAGKSTYEIRKLMVPDAAWSKVTDHRLVCAAGSATEQVTGSLKDAKK